jgi:putative sterol carrier protein
MNLAQAMASLPERFQAKMAGNLVTTIQFEFSGEGGGRWWLRIDQGECTTGRGEVSDPEATVRMSAADFAGINDGTINAPDVFWSGRIDIQGSVEAVLALPAVMQW